MTLGRRSGSGSRVAGGLLGCCGPCWLARFRGALAQPGLQPRPACLRGLAPIDKRGCMLPLMACSLAMARILASAAPGWRRRPVSAIRVNSACSLRSKARRPCTVRRAALSAQPARIAKPRYGSLQGSPPGIRGLAWVGLLAPWSPRTGTGQGFPPYGGETPIVPPFCPGWDGGTCPGLSRYVPPRSGLRLE